MKAIRVDRTGGPEVLNLVEMELPEPGPGEVRLRQSAAGVNYIDIYLREGIYPRQLPFVPGREGAGVVEAVGPDVRGLREGDRVAYCESHRLGGYAQYAIVPERWLVPIPDGIDERIACAAMLQGLTAHYLVNDTYPLKRGDTALIHAAAGGVGLLLVQMAKAKGATVLATCSERKTDLVKAHGADHVIPYDRVDFGDAVRELVGEHALAVVYDSVGRTTYETSMSLLRPRGMFALFGASSGPVPPIDPQRLAAAGSIFMTRPTLVHYIQTREELLGRAHDVFGSVAAGTLKVRIGGTYPLAEAARSHRDLASRMTTGKLLLLPES